MPHYQGVGLAIFQFEGDEIVDILFISFDVLKSEKEKKFIEIKNWLEEREIDLNNFKVSTRALEKKIKWEILINDCILDPAVKIRLGAADYYLILIIKNPVTVLVSESGPSDKGQSNPFIINYFLLVFI